MAVEVKKVEAPAKGKQMVDSPPRAKEAPVSVPQTISPTMAGRDQLYEAFNQYSDESAADAVKAGEVAPPEAELTETPQNAVTESGKEDEGDDPSKDQRTVNYGALKEERAKRKALQSQQEELNKQMQFLIEENKMFMEMLKDAGVGNKPAKAEIPETPDDSIEDYDRELIAHRKTIQDLQKKIEAFEGKAKSEAQVEGQKKLESMLKATAEKLAAEGFGGFESLIPLVQKELYSITDLKQRTALDNPDGWMKIYKEVVYPSVYGKASPPTKEDTDSRRSAKEAAARTRPAIGGRPPVPQDRSTGLSSFEEYMAGRRKNFPGLPMSK